MTPQLVSRMMTLVRLAGVILFAGFFQSGRAQADFVRNDGQWPEPVTFRAALPDGALWVERNALTFQFVDPEFLAALHPPAASSGREVAYREDSYRVTFGGGSPGVPSGQDIRPYYHNYYLGNDPARWADHVPVYGKCRLDEVYPHTDVSVYSHAGNLKYDFIVRPGGNPGLIQMVYSGGVNLEADHGDLVIRTTVNTVREIHPFAFQVIGGRLREVPCDFVLEGNTVRFSIGNYNRDHDLVIDPEIAFSTFVGSPASNFGFTACNDNFDHLISGAAVFGTGYPVTPGAFQSSFNGAFTNTMDIAISKFSPDGADLLYSTYLGGSHQETPHSLVVDSQDNILLMGVTGSSNFPVTPGSFQTAFSGGPAQAMNSFFTSSHPNGCDMFIEKFSAGGALLSGTFAGGPGTDGLNIADQLFYNYGDAFRGEINVDDADNIYVASVVRGPFPLPPMALQSAYGGGESDGILLRFNPGLTQLTGGTYLGGSAADACYAVEFETDGTVLVAGGTRSGNFPHAQNGVDVSHNGQCDGFVIRLNPASLTLISGTFIGTPAYDQAYFIQTDQAGAIYVLGQTDGTMPITPGLYGQPNSGQFIRKFDSTLSAVQWTTTIGTGSGSIDISPTAFLVSDCNQIYFSGWGGETNSFTCQSVYSCYASNSTTAGLPVTADAFQATTDGSDFYICVLSADATELVYGSFLGGGLSAEHVDGGTSRFDKNGSVYQAVCAGCQGNSDFPTTPGAWSSLNPSFGCNTAVFRFNLAQVSAEVQIEGPDVICEGSPVQFLNLSNGATTFEWTFGDGTFSDGANPVHSFDAEGTYLVTLIATDDLGCLLADTASITITVLPGVQPSAITPDPVCPGESVQLQGQGSSNLFWLSHPTLSDPSVPNPEVTPLSTTTYYLVDFNDCESDTVAVTVEVIAPATSISDPATICAGQSVILSAGGGTSYSWSPPEGLSSVSGPSVQASPTATTLYRVFINTAEGCLDTLTVLVSVVQDLPGGLVYDDIEMCLGAGAFLQAEDALTWEWSPATSLSNPDVQNPLASPADTTTYTVTMTNACGQGSSQVTVNVIFPAVQVFGGGTICRGQSVMAWASGASEYFWVPPAFASPANADTTWLSPPETTVFRLLGQDANGCSSQDSIVVTVIPPPDVNAGPDQYFDYPGSVYLFGNTYGLDYSWSPPAGLSCTDCPYPVASPEEATWYTLSATDANGCTGTDSVFVRPYYPVWVPNTITPNQDGINDVFRVEGVDASGYRLRIFDRWGIKVFDSTDFNEVWDGGLNGYYVPNDTYIWVLEYETVDRTRQLTGHVNVIR